MITLAGAIFLITFGSICIYLAFKFGLVETPEQTKKRMREESSGAKKTSKLFPRKVSSFTN